MEDNRPYKIPWPVNDLAEFIRRHCAKDHYMFFSKKIGKAICSCCGKEFDMSDLPHMVHEKDNRKLVTFCPGCRQMVTPKDMRYGRKKLTDVGRITWTRGIGSVTFIETDRFIIDYKNPYPAVILEPEMQIRLSEKKQERMDWKAEWYTRWKDRVGYREYGNWNEIKTIRLRHQPSAMWGYSKYHDHLYVPEDGALSVGTALRYADIDPERFGEEEFDEFRKVDRLIRYMSDFIKYPATEILEKSGFDIIVSNRACGCRSKYLNMRAKDLRKILKVDGADVKALRKENPTVGFLADLHNIRKTAPWIKVEDVGDVGEIMGRFIRREKMDRIRETADLSKLIRRILDYNRETGEFFTLNDYGDYLEAVVMLGWRLDIRTLYPKDFVGEHDKAISEAEEKKQELDTVNFGRFQKKITRMTEPFVEGEYMIRPARTPQELRKESRDLNHCVRTYIEKVARGETSILFIRKTEEPEKPFFTLELSPRGEIVQCRGDHNRGCPQDVNRFVDCWKAQWDKERKRA